MDSRSQPLGLHHRNYRKCTQCRRDKKQCLPFGRDWIAKKEKCERCNKLGHSCGPSVGKRRKPTEGTTTIEWNLDKSHHKQPTREWEQVTGCPRASKLDSGTRLRCESSIDWHFDLQSVSHTSCKIAEIRARDTIGKLDHLYATRELLRSDLLLCDRVEQLLDHSDSIPETRAALEAYICVVKADFEHELREALSIVESQNHLGYFRDSVLSVLLRILYQFQNPPVLSSSSPSRKVVGGVDQQLIQRMLHVSRRTSSIYSDADFVCGGLWSTHFDNTKRVATIPRHPVSYIRASLAIDDMFSKIVLRDLKSEGPLQGQVYPPSHIAYMHGDENVAFELWRDIDGHLVTDILDRTILHLVVYAADAHILQCMLHHNQKAVSMAKPDQFGMTPLQIAACLDDVPCFSLMWQYVTDGTESHFMARDVLDLAVKSGSRQVVALILQSGCRVQLLNSALDTVIAARHEQIKNMLTSHSNGYTPLYSSDWQAGAAYNAAMTIGSRDTAAKFANFGTHPLNPQASSIALDQSMSDIYDYNRSLASTGELCTDAGDTLESLYTSDPETIPQQDYSFLMHTDINSAMINRCSVQEELDWMDSQSLFSLSS